MDDVPVVLRVPGGTVELHADGLTLTRLDGVGEVHARPHDSGEYRARARELGYGEDTAAMSREHELCHALLAKVLALPRSPTLAGVAAGRHWPHWREEEAAVLAVQRFARAAGVTLTEVAREAFVAAQGR